MHEDILMKLSPETLRLFEQINQRLEQNPGPDPPPEFVNERIKEEFRAWLYQRDWERLIREAQARQAQGPPPPPPRQTWLARLKTLGSAFSKTLRLIPNSPRGFCGMELFDN